MFVAAGVVVVVGPVVVGVAGFAEELQVGDGGLSACGVGGGVVCVGGFGGGAAADTASVAGGEDEALGV